MLGTGAQIATGLLGLDLPADIRDLTHDLTHWQWSWGHVGQTLLDGVGVLPVVGSIKYLDEAGALVKGAAKHVDETVDMAKNAENAIDKISDIEGGILKSENANVLENLEKTETKGYSRTDNLEESKKTPDELYKDILNSKADVADIAKHNNLKPERIQKIKDYVFDNPNHIPHKPTAEAWERLSKGKGTEHDKLLLKHETAEMFYNDWIKKNSEKYMERYDPLSSHDITNYKGYDWESGLPTK
jgi:hypothetical protein